MCLGVEEVGGSDVGRDVRKCVGVWGSCKESVGVWKIVG